MVDLVKRIAAEKNATAAQIALAWLLAQAPWIAPIPGTSKVHRLQKNLGAVHVELSKADLQQIGAAAAAIEVVGARYLVAMQARVGK